MQEVPTPPMCEVVILTALGVEYKAVREHLQGIQELTHQGTVYEYGNFTGQDHTWHVAVVEIGMGGQTAATETERAIRYFQSQIALFVGVGGGLKDVKLGDVVAATKVYAYESGKIGQEFQPRPEAWRASHNLEQRARAEARNDEWLTRLNRSRPNPAPQVHIGALAAGEKVLASTQSDLFRLLKATYGDTLAVEMEGHGFLAAVHANHSVHGLVIRGISDLINGKSATDATGSQAVAARHAAAFAFQVLAKFPPPDSKRGGTVASPPSQKAVTDYLYDVAFSYAGEDRIYAEKLATILLNRGVRVFYDRFEQSHLWGKNLYTYLSDLYQNKARYCVMFLSQYYAAKMWTTLEREAAQSRAFKEHEEYILPIRLDDTEIPGILRTTSFMDWHQETAESIAHNVQKKLEEQLQAPLQPPPVHTRRRSIPRRVFLVLAGLAAVGTASSGLLWQLLSRNSQASSHAPITTNPISSPPSAPTSAPLGTTLYTYKGHLSSVYAVAWSPSGERIASVGTNVQVWDAYTGNNVVTYHNHSDRVTDVTWSPDGKRNASSSWDKTVQIWNPRNGENIFTYYGHSAAVTTVAWSPDGTSVASGGEDKTIQVWNANTGDIISTCRGHTGGVWDVIWSPDGKLIASAGGNDDGTVRVWNPTTGNNVSIYRGHSGPVVGIRWLPNGNIASAGEDSRVQISSGETKILSYLSGARILHCLTASPNGELLAFEDVERSLLVWNIKTEKAVFSYFGHGDPVYDLDWSPDGGRIASASYDKTVKVWQAG